MGNEAVEGIKNPTAYRLACKQSERATAARIYYKNDTNYSKNMADIAVIAGNKNNTLR